MQTCVDLINSFYLQFIVEKQLFFQFNEILFWEKKIKSSTVTVIVTVIIGEGILYRP